MISPARTAAHTVLRHVHTGRADLSRALHTIRGRVDDPRDRALVTEIATGTLRMRAAVDHIVAVLSSRPLDAIDPDVLDALRSAVYQLVYLDRVPSHAVVHDAVELSRRASGVGAAGFVNAVLRAVSRDPAPTAMLPSRPDPPQPDTAQGRTPILDYLSTTLSHPRWLVERWLDRYGFEATERWALFNNTPAPVTLRVNVLRTNRTALTETLAGHAVTVEPGRWSRETLVTLAGTPLATHVADTGMFSVQDEASQLVAELVAAERDQTVLDLCASPGGKTVAIAGRMENTGVLIANDLRPRRLSLLTRTLARFGCHNTRVICCDGRRPLPFLTRFDWVLVDAPCSGLGTLRRDPDIRWRRDQEDLETWSGVQSAMLTTAAQVVAPNGRLVYATCSSEPEENQHVVDRFLATATDFAIERPAGDAIAPLIDERGYFLTLPHRDGLDAFFGAVLKRRAAADTSTS